MTDVRVSGIIVVKRRGGEFTFRDGRDHVRIAGVSQWKSQKLQSMVKPVYSGFETGMHGVLSVIDSEGIQCYRW